MQDTKWVHLCLFKALHVREGRDLCCRKPLLERANLESLHFSFPQPRLDNRAERFGKPEYTATTLLEKVDLSLVGVPGGYIQRLNVDLAEGHFISKPGKSKYLITSLYGSDYKN